MKPRSLGTPNFFSRKAKKAFECCWFASGFRLFKLTCQKHSQSAILRTNVVRGKLKTYDTELEGRIQSAGKGQGLVVVEVDRDVLLWRTQGLR